VRITERIDRATHVPAALLSLLPPAPRSAKIELSTRCNYRCQFCALSSREVQPQRDMSFEVFIRVAQKLHDAGVEEYGLFLMGESFMAPELLVQSVRYLKNTLQVPYVFLTSNASLAGAEIVKRVMDAGLDSLKWSVNANSVAQFAAVTGASGGVYRQTYKNVQAAWALRRTHGYITRLYASSIHYDDAQRVEMQAFIDREVAPFVDEHYWLPLYSMGGVSAIGGGNPGRRDNPVAALPCWQLFSEAHVLVDGRMTTCSFDATGRMVVGDLLQHSFLDIWHSEAFQALRCAHLAGGVTGTACAPCVVGC
jgi:uncharacterized Fe-S cluster-containing radical SAM superfamily protein